MPSKPSSLSEYLKDTVADRPKTSSQPTQCVRAECTPEPGACQKELGTSWDWLAYLRQLLHRGAWILLSDSRLAPLLLLLLPPLPPHFPLPFQSLSNSGSLAAFLSSVAAGRLRWPESVPWSCGQSSWDCLAGGRTSAGAEVSEKKNPQQPYLFHLSYHPFILSLSFSFPLSHPLLTLSLPPLPFSSSSIFFTSFFLLSPPTHSLSFSPWFGGWRLTMNYMATRETDSSRQICS